MAKTSALLTIFSLALLAGSPVIADESAGDATLAEWIADTAALNRHAIDFDGRTFSGPGWERLLREGRRARFFLIGEEHGIAENPRLAAQLFEALAPSGYRRMLIEISPPMAAVVDDALADGGLEGLKSLFAEPGGQPAFFGMAEEAEMLAAVRAAVPVTEPALWGADYEVASDRALIRRLEATPKPAAADAALATLAQASRAGWAKHAETGEPRHIFTFTGDPELVRAVEKAWPMRDAESTWILDSLEETLEINRLWAEGKRYESNRRRAAFLRENLIRHWAPLRDTENPPRVMAKFGANHMVRGRNMTQTYDLGTLLPELAVLDGSSSFSVMVVPGRGSPTAVLNASTWTYESAPPKDDYQRGLEPLLDAALPDAFTLIDLRPIRAVVATKSGDAGDALLRVVFGFDMLLVMTGSTAAAQFEHDRAGTGR